MLVLPSVRSRTLCCVYLLTGAVSFATSLELPLDPSTLSTAATPQSSEELGRVPWGQSEEVKARLSEIPQARSKSGGLVRCPEAGEGWEALEWVVQLKQDIAVKTLLGYEYRRSLNTEELYSIANSIAVSTGLDGGIDHVEQFHGVFRLRYASRDGQRLQHRRNARLRRVSRRLWRRSSRRFGRRLASLDRNLGEHPSIEWAVRQRCLVRQKRGFDLDFNDPMFSKQWHLVNSREAGHDINVTEVWYNKITGSSVVIAVVDDGLEHTNDDIELNYNVLGSYDYNDNDPDPSPNLKSKGDNTHGTKCAGLISAVANNSHCAVGVAHGASVSGIRMLDGKVTDVLEAQSFIHKAHINWIFSCSWGPEDNGKTVEGPGRLAQQALKMGTSDGRYGYGNIYVFASGNGGQMNDNCNFDGYANSIYTLTVGAVDEKNKMPYYAEPCPSMLAVTYSNGHSNGDRNIVTTDASSHGGCTKSFSGTSAAAPIAAGMVALMLQTRHCLTWRDVQSILVYSAVKVDVSGAEWVENGAGFHHSDQHGFGLMDAYRMTIVARSWPLLPPLLKRHVTGSGRSRRIPTNESLLVAIIVPGDDAHTTTTPSNSHHSPPLNTLEYVALTVSLEHERRGDLQISLLSPNSTYSTLSTTRKHDDVSSGLDRWTFTTSRFWGENQIGVWILNITDTKKSSSKQSRGVLKDWTLTLYGSELTPDDVQQRKRLVEDVLVDGFSRAPLPCPPLPSNLKELTLPLKLGQVHLWKLVVVVVLAVVGGVILVHVVLEIVTTRYRLWKRHRNQLQSASNNVAYSRGPRRTRGSKVEDGSEGEDSDSLETSRLISFADDRDVRSCDLTTPADRDMSFADDRDEQSMHGYVSTTLAGRNSDIMTFTDGRGDQSVNCSDSIMLTDRDSDVQVGMRLVSPSSSHSTMDDGVCGEEGDRLLMVDSKERSDAYHEGRNALEGTRADSNKGSNFSLTEHSISDNKTGTSVSGEVLEAEPDQHKYFTSTSWKCTGKEEGSENSDKKAALGPSKGDRPEDTGGFMPTPSSYSSRSSEILDIVTDVLTIEHKGTSCMGGDFVVEDFGGETGTADTDN